MGNELVRDKKIDWTRSYANINGVMYWHDLDVVLRAPWTKEDLVQHLLAAIETDDYMHRKPGQITITWDFAGTKQGLREVLGRAAELQIPDIMRGVKALMDPIKAEFDRIDNDDF